VSQIPANVRTALRWALVYATVYSVIVMVLALIRGTGPFEALGTSLLRVLAVYWGGALVVGAIVGLLLPLAQASTWGAMLVGGIAGLPIGCAVTLVTMPQAQWAANVLVGAVCGAMLGILFALAFKAK